MQDANKCKDCFGASMNDCEECKSDREKALTNLKYLQICINSGEQKWLSKEWLSTIKVIINDLEELSAYENADLIKRQAVLEDMGNTYNLYLNNQNHFDREDMAVVHKTYDFINKGIYDIPRFEPTEVSAEGEERNCAYCNIQMFQVLLNLARGVWNRTGKTIHTHILNHKIKKKNTIKKRK